MAKKTGYEIRVVKCGGVKEPMNNPEYNNLPRVICPENILGYFTPWRSQTQEHFVCFSLDGSGNVLNCRVITIGLINHSLVAPRETFRGAIMDNAVSIIVAHNHPSGSLEPSPQDIAITRQLKEAGDILGIQLIDHVIVTSTGHVSLRERGLI